MFSSSFRQQWSFQQIYSSLSLLFTSEHAFPCMNLFIIQNFHKDKNTVYFKDCRSILLQDYNNEYWLIIIFNSCCLMDCIIHKFLVLLLVYFPIKRPISMSWSRIRHTCPLFSDLGRYCPSGLLSYFEKPHSGDYQQIPLIFLSWWGFG